jgi:hypothetical protein
MFEEAEGPPAFRGQLRDGGVSQEQTRWAPFGASAHLSSSVTKVGAFIQMSGGSGPDGLAIDENDNLAVCHVGFGAVWLFSALGEPMLRINSPQRHPHHQRRLWRSRQHNYFKL